MQLPIKPQISLSISYNPRSAKSFNYYIIYYFFTKSFNFNLNFFFLSLFICKSQAARKHSQYIQENNRTLKKIKKKTSFIGRNWKKLKKKEDKKIKTVFTFTLTFNKKQINKIIKRLFCLQICVIRHRA